MLDWMEVWKMGRKERRERLERVKPGWLGMGWRELLDLPRIGKETLGLQAMQGRQESGLEPDLR